MQLDLTVLTKTRESNRCCGLHTYGGKSTLNTRFYHFNVS
jgi:hypothetical protein